MRRSLCLLIGKEPLTDHSNYMKLTKSVDDPRNLDAYIMNRFASSDDVRMHFKEQIDEYLNKNKNIINSITERTGKTYRGSIVIIEEKKDGTLRKVSVLYSDTCAKIKLMLNDINFMKFLALSDEVCSAKYMKLFSLYQIDSILSRNGQDYPLKELKKILLKWKEKLKEDYYGTDKLRIVLKKYDEYKKELKIDQKTLRRV